MIKQAGSKLCQDQLNFNCQNPNQTLTQPVGLYPKMTLHTSHPTPPPPTETQCQQYLSYYWTDFGQALKDQIEIFHFLHIYKKWPIYFGRIGLQLIT